MSLHFFVLALLLLSVESLVPALFSQLYLLQAGLTRSGDCFLILNKFSFDGLVSLQLDCLQLRLDRLEFLLSTLFSLRHL